MRLLAFLVSLVFLSASGAFPTSKAEAAEYVARGDMVGELKVYTVQKDETLWDIARAYDMGINEMKAANPGVNAWKPGPGRAILIPSLHTLPPKREGIVVNLTELRLYYFTPEGRVMTFPIAAGKDGWKTPTANTKIALKRENPTWVVPDSIKAEDPTLPDFIPPGPDNPLGKYALNLGIPGYRFHGTLAPRSIGSRASHGCMRMYPEDIETLFHSVPVGTPVSIVSLDYKLGWKGRELFVEVMGGKRKPAARSALARAITRDIGMVAGSEVTVDPTLLAEAVAAGNGVPVAIGKRGFGFGNTVAVLFDE
ncbi:MAG TPA: L,D-transpeptidase family protein [Patescibacteria group bacterium]|nr:L,D-transpeptidase family protein [Patescibacteria group bacterium]